MKHLYSFFALIALVGVVGAQTTIDFSVDMNGEVVSPNGVHIAGSFQGWDPAATELTDPDMDGVYTYSTTISMPGIVEFKFINGNDWPDVESVPEACTVEVGGNSNRAIPVLGTAITIPYSVCYGSCAPCGITTVRFRVDMSSETVSSSGVHVAGGFQGWDPATTEMFDITGNGIYETIASFTPDTTQSIGFKFINGNSWVDISENLSGQPCDDGSGNRVLALTSENVVLSVPGTTTPVCFNSCGSCVFPTIVTLRIDMTTQAEVSVNGVHVAGNFQGWSPSDTPLNDDDGDGIWEVVLDIAPGDYQFKFINGDDWGGNGVGNVDNEMIVGSCVVDGNRTLTVGLDAVIYEACYNNCPGQACLPDPTAADITFRVNMADETTSADGVYLIGSFTTPSWQSGTIPMTDDNADGVWEVTTNVSGAAEIQYKFANGNPFPAGEPDYTVEETGTVIGVDSTEVFTFESDSCGVPNGFGAFNRLHVRTGDPEILNIACYNRCSDCGTDGIYSFNEIAFNLFPNPANNSIVITTKESMQSAVISITDAQGRMVYIESVNTINENGSISIDVSYLSTGIYNVSINSGDFSGIKRLVIE